MIYGIDLEKILFLDIETVPEYEHYQELDEHTQGLWEAKTSYKRKNEISAEDYYSNAGIWAEFGKIICISVGYLVYRGSERKYRTTSFHGEEEELLRNFKNLVETHFDQPTHRFCAHNGKEFDFPYIARRMIIHGILLPDKLNFFGKKPWEIPHLDTMELWKFGDFKHYTSLVLLAHVLGIPSPKDDIDGSQVRDVFYEDKDLDRIITYCEKDTVTLAQVVLRLQNLPLLEDDEVVSVG